MEDTVCSGRLEKVPTGQGVGLCDAAARVQGRYGFRSKDSSLGLEAWNDL